MRSLFFSESFFKLLFNLFIAAAYDYKFFVIGRFQQALHHFLHIARAHAAACRKDIFLIIRKSQLFSCRFLGNFSSADLGHRDSERNQLLFRHSPPRKYLCQALVRDNVIIRVRLLPERNAGVIGHNRYRERQLHPLALHIGDGFRRIDVGHNQHIHRVFFNEAFEIFRHKTVYIVHKRFARNSAYEHSELVGKAEQPRSFFNNTDISVADQLGDALSRQCQIVQHICFIPVSGHGFRNRVRGGIVSAAGITGQNQCFHRILRSFCIFVADSSLCTAIRLAIFRDLF